MGAISIAVLVSLIGVCAYAATYFLGRGHRRYSRQRLALLDLALNHERRQAADALAQSEARYRALFEDAPVSLWEEDFSRVKHIIEALRDAGVTDFRAYFAEHPAEGGRCAGAIRIIDVNQATLQLFKAASKERLLEGLPAVFCPESLATFKEELITFAGGGVRFQSEAVLRNLADEELHAVVGCSIAPGHEKSWDRVLVFVNDITAQKRASDALRERESFIRDILETVDEGFIVVGRDHRILSANQAFCRLVNSAEEEVVGRLCHEVLPYLDRPCLGPGEECRIWRTLESGSSHYATHTLADASGARRYVEVKSYPLTDATGTVVSAIETINDVTEKRKLGEQLRQAQKMEAIGRLAGGVAHDFNNMLAVIMGNTELVMEEVDHTRPFFSKLQEVLRAAERSAGLTRQLLAFARKQTITPRVLDLNGTMEGMLNILRRLIGENINLVWRPGSEVWPVRMDPSQIDQILANLCLNARDAISGEGRVTIETGNVSIDEPHCAGRPEVIAGDYILLAVSDDGCGMNRQVLSRLFEPFFTTKGAGEGTGLGLATVYGIVKQNNGFLEVASEPGQGSTFRIYLPRHSGPAGQEAGDSPALPAARGCETILLVEDEPAMRTMTGEMLMRFGYRVLAAATPAAAIQAAREHPAEIHLLITDVVMPGMNGRELADQLLSFYPEIRCLFMSGYPGDVIAPHGVLEGRMNFVPKPFSAQALTAKIREMLDRG